MTSSTAAWKIESSQNHLTTYSESALKIHIKIMEEGLFVCLFVVQAKTVVYQLRKPDCVVAHRKHKICSISFKFKKADVYFI